MNYAPSIETTGFEIFEPLTTVRVGQPVFIATYGLAPISKMSPVTDWLDKASVVRLMVGFSKESMDLNALKTSMLEYKSLGWSVRAIPSFHAKIWGIGEDAWVGSCNFTPSTIVNYMTRVPWATVHDFASLYWKQAHAISESSKLWLLPQSKTRDV